MSELSISNVIRVTVQGVQRGKSVKNINEVALFTPEMPNNNDPYMICIDPSDVVKAYGTGSLTAEMAQNVFAQNANLNSGKGYLVVIPMKNAVDASSASFSTPAISSIESFKTVKDGALKVTVDGTAYDLSGLNFENCSNVGDIATVLSNALSGVYISSSENKITFTSPKLGDASSVVLSSGTGGTDISGENYLNVATGETVAGTNSSGETLEEAIERTINQVRYTGVMTSLYMEDAVINSASSFINSNDLIWVMYGIPLLIYRAFALKFNRLHSNRHVVWYILMDLEMQS